MKKLNLCFTMAISAFFIGMSVSSCQMNDADDYYQEAEIVTPADLFISSEAYQNLEKEISKNIRRRQNAVDKLSKEEKKLYIQLMEQLLNPETRTDAREQLNILLGYDENEERNRIMVIAKEVYEGVNVSRLELLRAWQKRQMHQVVISTRASDLEAYKECMENCKKDMKLDTNRCWAEFNEDLELVPEEEKLHQSGPLYDYYKSILDSCLDITEFRWTSCQEVCIFRYGS